MAIHVQKEILFPAAEENVCTILTQYYADSSSTHRIQRKDKTAESDFNTASEEQESFDNGKTWGPWHDVYKESYSRIPGGEKLDLPVRNRTVHPGNRHLLSLRMERRFIGDHKAVYAQLWNNGSGAGYLDHSFLDVHGLDGKRMFTQFLRYEDGPEEILLDDREGRGKNTSYALGNVTVAPDGDILFTMSVSMRKCCAMLGTAAEKVFPSCPDVATGMIVVRGCWNEEKGRYLFQYSKPVVISDLLSSRGILEPTAAILNSGRIVIVFRGSNMRRDSWHTRLEPGTPGVKWVVWSDDGGKTFTEPQPWHFDNGEFVYSPSSISYFFRSPKNGRLHWIGNVTPPVGIDGNEPRWPLQIVEVNEYGFAIRETLTEIDTRQPGESEVLQLSNFTLLHDREDPHTEVYLARYGQQTLPGMKNFYQCDSCRYRIDWDD